MRTLLILAATLALAVAAAPAAAHAAGRPCGTTPKIDGARYDTLVVKGNVACSTVRRVVTRFMRTSKATRPWKCLMDHRGSSYNASCTRGRGVRVLVYVVG